MLEKPEQRRRLGSEQPLQTHEKEAERAEPGAAVLEPSRQQLVLDRVDAVGRATDDVEEHVGLR